MIRHFLAASAYLAVGLVLSSARAGSQAKIASTPDSEGLAWWKHAVFYEIYPRSFADSNNDGVGDINGITSKLDYLDSLGVTALWITPCFPSPQVDFGYDVADYQNIDPMYGALADFDRLVREAKKRGIRIVLDFVINHTSDQHPWFVNSRSSRDSRYRDWYIWRDGKGPGLPPNNWLSTFGGSAWTFDPTTGQYYYHYFYPQQPDLNWRNPEVQKAMFDVVRFWYERGVAGFRLDAVRHLYEDPQLRDNPVLTGKNEFGDPKMDNVYNMELPEIHGVLRDLRTLSDQYGAVLIGETWTKDISQLQAYYGLHNDELQLPMDFLFTMVNKLSPDEFRKQIAAVQDSGGWPVYVFSNHDLVRAYTRFGDGRHNPQIAKLLAAFYLTLRGTPIMYYGEEIGMENNDPKSVDEVKDPIGKLGWPEEKGRDGERTPMQWTSAKNAGFSVSTPWLPVPPSHKKRNVETELKDKNSILNFYKRLLSLRRSEPALAQGDYVALNEADASVLSYLRRYKDQAILVALNMTSARRKVSFDLSPQGFSSPNVQTILSSSSRLQRNRTLRPLSMPPFSAYVARITR